MSRDDATSAAVSVDELRKTPLFAACSPTELQAIVGLVERLDVAEGEELVTAGAPARRLLVVLAGVAHVIRAGEHVNTVAAGDFIGELAAVDGHTHTATVIAQTPMDVLVVPATDIPRLLEQQGVAARLMERMASWLRMTPRDGEPTSTDGMERTVAPRRTRRTAAGDHAGWDAVTVAERRVIDLVAHGNSNPQVADALFISRHTVESHLKSVYMKLGVSSRTELAAEVHRRHRSPG